MHHDDDPEAAPDLDDSMEVILDTDSPAPSLHATRRPCGVLALITLLALVLVVGSVVGSARRRERRATQRQEEQYTDMAVAAGKRPVRARDEVHEQDPPPPGVAPPVTNNNTLNAPSLPPATATHTMPTATAPFSPTTSSSTAAPSPSPTRQPQAVATTEPAVGGGDDSNRRCNNVEGLCELPLNEVLFAAAHNAMADSTFWISNQRKSLEEALDAGVRSLYLDMGVCGNSFELKHSYCFVGSRDPTEVFSNIVTFLQNNPDEVVLITLELDDGVQPGDIYNHVLSNVHGLTKMLHDQNDNKHGDWPTLGELVDRDQRLLLYHYNGPTCAQVDCPPGFGYWWDIAAETEFVLPNIDTALEPDVACRLTRGSRNLDNMFGVNLFVEFPSLSAAAQLNSAVVLEQHLQDCKAVNGGHYNPNIIVVDFWDLGEVVPTVNKWNAGLVEERRRRRLQLLP